MDTSISPSSGGVCTRSSSPTSPTREDFYAAEGVHVSLRDGLRLDNERCATSPPSARPGAADPAVRWHPWVALTVNTHRPLFWFLARPV